jgi:hypothetical protein
MLFQEIKASGYDGCYSRVTDFIRAWRQSEGKAVSTSAFVPLHLELGENRMLAITRQVLNSASAAGMNARVPFAASRRDTSNAPVAVPHARVTRTSRPPTQYRRSSFPEADAYGQRRPAGAGRWPSD